MEKSAIIGSGEHGNVENLLNTFHRGAEEADIQLYFGCYHPQGRFLGTDALENWHVNDFYDWSLPHFKSGEGWIFRPIPNSRKVTYFPNEASPIYCTFDELLESHQFLATSRGSGTLVYDKTKKNWLVGQYHLSFPIPNDIATHMTKKISIFETSAKEIASAEAARKLIEEWDLEESKPSTGPTKSKKKGGKKRL